MHRYTPCTDLDGPLARVEDFRFHDALDVIEFASLEWGFDRKSATEVWHLDAIGAYLCGGSFDPWTDIRQLAKRPSLLHESRRRGVAAGGCPDRWLIHDFRPNRWGLRDPDSADVRAFTNVRAALAPIGVHLLDCMVWSKQLQCWSLHELTSGTTRWRDPAGQME